jgi:hypothetical protein
VFDVWWSEARLHDLKREFLVEKVVSEENNDMEVIRPRLLEKCKEKAFYINDEISSRINNDELISLMKSFAIEASFTLEIISKLDRIHEMKQMDAVHIPLYDLLMQNVKQDITNLASNEVHEDEIQNNIEGDNENSINQQLINDIKNGMLDDGDEIMLQIFSSTFDGFAKHEPKRVSSPLDIYKTLNNATTTLLLPLENSIERNIRELLSKKISIAEKFVMEIYHEEFLVAHYLQEIRKVFFLESNHLLLFFNSKVFPLMESDDSSWANPYLLTISLNEAISTGRITSTLFNVQVNKKLGHHSVFDAINEITISVNMNHNLNNIFTSSCIHKYNEGIVIFIFSRFND